MALPLQRHPLLLRHDLVIARSSENHARSRSTQRRFCKSLGCAQPGKSETPQVQSQKPAAESTLGSIGRGQRENQTLRQIGRRPRCNDQLGDGCCGEATFPSRRGHLEPGTPGKSVGPGRCD
ncbi:hypothetical protein LIA77_07884 [Sarocladium implicatum]|nr:hypothetical protein LIA77_07884 [Sarocladium implicatum]